ncbi:hypothetical protein L7F22_029516, partial [Adiantum nelumboides]|nr:hypothetical protein [Adiantum nelumboides]
WVTQAVLFTVKEEYIRSYGERIQVHRRVSFDKVKPIFQALDFLPYVIDKEYQEHVDTTVTFSPSYNVPNPPIIWPYRNYSFPPWKPILGYNPLDDQRSYVSKPWSD